MYEKLEANWQLKAPSPMCSPPVNQSSSRSIEPLPALHTAPDSMASTTPPAMTLPN